MGVAIFKASQEERGLVENLLQFYIYDFTEFTGAAILEDGSYRTLPDLESYWNESSENYIYLIKTDDEIAGFIFVKEIEESKKYNFLAHFFILRKFRRRGIGQKAAELVLMKFPGEWKLYQLKNNLPAQKFWDRVIHHVSRGKINTKFENGRRYQSFICK